MRSRIDQTGQLDPMLCDGVSPVIHVVKRQQLASLGKEGEEHAVEEDECAREGFVERLTRTRVRAEQALRDRRNRREDSRLETARYIDGVQDAVVERSLEKRPAVRSRSEGLGSEERREVAEIIGRAMLEQLHQVNFVARAFDERALARVKPPQAAIRQDPERLPREKDVISDLGDRISLRRASIEREIEALGVSDGERPLHLRTGTRLLGRLPISMLPRSAAQSAVSSRWRSPPSRAANSGHAGSRSSRKCSEKSHRDDRDPTPAGAKVSSGCEERLLGRAIVGGVSRLVLLVDHEVKMPAAHEARHLLVLVIRLPASVGKASCHCAHDRLSLLFARGDGLDGDEGVGA